MALFNEPRPDVSDRRGRRGGVMWAAATMVSAAALLSSISRSRTSPADMYGPPYLTNAATAAPISDIWA